jgi:hypothetical protein
MTPASRIEFPDWNSRATTLGPQCYLGWDRSPTGRCPGLTIKGRGVVALTDAVDSSGSGAHSAGGVGPMYGRKYEINTWIP